jgi:hypothetical protein
MSDSTIDTEQATATAADGHAGSGIAVAELTDSSLYLNRELSWLDFNDRVLQLSEDE